MNPIPYEPVRMTAIILLSVSDVHEHFKCFFLTHRTVITPTYTDSVETH